MTLRTTSQLNRPSRFRTHTVKNETSRVSRPKTKKSPNRTKPAKSSARRNQVHESVGRLCTPSPLRSTSKSPAGRRKPKSVMTKSKTVQKTKQMDCPCPMTSKPRRKNQGQNSQSPVASKKTKAAEEVTKSVFPTYRPRTAHLIEELQEHGTAGHRKPGTAPRPKAPKRRRRVTTTKAKKAPAKKVIRRARQTTKKRTGSKRTTRQKTDNACKC